MRLPRYAMITAAIRRGAAVAPIAAESPEARAPLKIHQADRGEPLLRPHCPTVNHRADQSRWERRCLAGPGHATGASHQRPKTAPHTVYENDARCVGGGTGCRIML